MTITTRHYSKNKLKQLEKREEQWKALEEVFKDVTEEEIGTLGIRMGSGGYLKIRTGIEKDTEDMTGLGIVRGKGNLEEPVDMKNLHPQSQPRRFKIGEEQ